MVFCCDKSLASHARELIDNTTILLQLHLSPKPIHYELVISLSVYLMLKLVLAWPAPTYYLNKSWNMVNWMSWMSCGKWLPFCLGLNLMRHTITCPDSKIHGANVGPTWGRQDPGGPHVGHTNLVIWVWYHYRERAVLSRGRAFEYLDEIGLDITVPHCIISEREFICKWILQSTL